MLHFVSQLHDITHSWKLKKGLVTSHDVNCIIKDHASRGDLKGVLSLLSELRSNGFAITKENYNNILIAFQNVYTADTARYICLCLIADGMSPDLTTYTFLIKAHVLTGDVSSAFTFYRKMERAGIRADLTVYTTLIDGLVGKGLLDNAWRLYGYIRTWRLIQPDVHLFTTMIKASAHSGDTHRAVSLYDEMLQLNISPTSHTYEALIHCCSREKCYAQRCLEFYDRMRCNDTPIRHDTLIHLLRACKNIGNTRKAMDVLRDASDQGINIDENILAAAINVMLNDSFESTASYFRKTEGVRKACCLVRSLLTLKKVVTTKVMNTIMEVYENAGYYDYAVAAYNYFHRLGVEPDHQSHTILLRIFGEKLRDPCRFFAVWQTVRDNIKPGREFLNVALDMAMLSNSAKRTLYILEHMYESKTHPLPELAATLHIKGRNIPQIHIMINRLFCLQKSLSYDKKQKDHQMMQTFLDENRLYYAN
ncbi:pentatricopeptide repeat domain containing protein, putative [Babesia bigemina]|uniref:Pentatricopeptide repeat domain containing protein, putative n=1 Tax=Babesia bigemina TaxID=5866 RepID=A0A061D474_BABBI|nr:pentatricopeptide repeat domain containing protein, putative [Babesia bigemina]CDR95373.1 pentatricopeptide repeat domain containing protein, putative [Babesia bigemina]|eukprot:XP_012767559.1 pentatricopeptide repeat domain containing protein, putative [Babesia bigemina]